MKKKNDTKKDNEVGLAGKPKVMSFDEYCGKRVNEDAEAPSDQPQFARDSVQGLYDRYMPLIWDRVSTQEDIKQVVAMVQRDAQNHPLVTSGTSSGLALRRGQDLDRFANFRQ